jgi:Icc-related predicted phosphoesterase
MKVAFTADLHGRLPEIHEQVSLLIIAGDICPDFHDMSRARLGTRAHTGRRADVGEQRQRHWLDTTFRAWLDEVPADNVVAIAGNHDFVFEHKFLMPRNLRWHFLQDETAIVEGVHIHGVPWVPNLARWAFYGDSRKLEAVYDNVPNGLDILITHGPPFGWHDAVGPQFMRPGMETNHVGSLECLGAITRAKPEWVVTGHIHEGFGSSTMWHEGGGCSQIRNVAHVDESYSDNVRAPLILTI